MRFAPCHQSGCYRGNEAVRGNDDPCLPKTAGYISSMVGKWGQLPLTPEEWGFDDTFRFRVAVFTGTRPTKRFRIGLTEQSIIFKMANTCLT